MLKKNVAVWGTGNVCTQIFNENTQMKVDFFIDNDIRKNKKKVFGKKIVHPSWITDWKKIYIIIAIDNYSSVKEYLSQRGLYEQVDFMWYRDWLFPRNVKQILSEAKQFLTWIDTQNKYNGCKLIFSDFLAFDKGVCDFVNEWNKIEKNMVLLSEALWVSKERIEKLHITSIKLPAVLAHNQYLKKSLDGEIDEQLISYVRERRYLNEAAVNLRMGYRDMASDYEYIVCYFADRIVRKILKCWTPCKVIIWNAFYALHIIVKEICKEMNICVQYMEFGNIPGTIIVEEIGQMGESWPARFPQKFMRIPVYSSEYTRAEQQIKKLCQSKLNRNVQPYNNLLRDVKKSLKVERPIVFYAGQNDNASGMQPYTEKTKEFHSPMFTSSDEAAVFLASICKKNSWNYIYKPHPMMFRWCEQSILPENTILVDNVDINELIDLSDIVVTVLSTVSYIALIRQKPVVMLGYTQLKSKGCTYEAFRLKDIEKQISAALNNHLTSDMHSKFVNHVVQLEKYYSNILLEVK